MPREGIFLFLRTAAAELGMVSALNLHNVLRAVNMILHALVEGTVDSQGIFSRIVLIDIGAHQNEAVHQVRMFRGESGGHGAAHGMSGNVPVPVFREPGDDFPGRIGIKNRQMERHMDQNAGDSGRSIFRIFKKIFMTDMPLSVIVILSVRKRTGITTEEGLMEFTCHTTYNQKTLTAMSRAIRKTVRAKRNRRIRLFAWIIIGLLLVSVWLSWDNIWQTAANSITIAALLLLNWKEDTINGYFARRKALPGTDCADTAFYPDHFLVKTEAAEARWKYDRILALAETRNYLVLVMGKDHALAVEKANLKGGSISGFIRFLEEQSGRIFSP